MITQFLRYCSLGLLFLTTFIPLYVANNLFFPFITGKAFAFRVLVEIAFAFWLLLVLRDKKYAPRFSWVTVAATAFVVGILITDLLGLNPIRSLWSNFERMEGWVTIIHLWAYFIMITSLFGPGEHGRRMWHNFFKVTIVAAGIVGIYGLFQLFGWAAVHQGSSRIDASLGNAAYMAVYMLIHTFLAWYLGLVAYEKKEKGFVWMYGIVGLVFAFLLFETATRGTILGLVGGLLLALGIYGVFGKGESKEGRIISLSGIALIILLGIGLFAAKNTNFVKNQETLNRLASISINESKTQARGYIWPMAVKGVFASPKTALIGVGQENFNYIFNANYNPEMWRHEQWFDRAHNVFLDWLVAGGLVGIILYLSLFGLAIAGLWKSNLSFNEKCLLTGLFVGYAIHNIFVFDNLASYMLFFTMLGFVHTLSAQKPFKWLEKKDIQTENMVVVRDYIFFPVVVILFVVTFYFINIRPIQANTRLISALVACSSGKPSADLYAKALDLNQYVANQEAREQLLSCSSNVIASSLPNETKTQFYTLALKEIEKNSQVNPNDARGYLIAGSFLNGIADWGKAVIVLEKAIELSPNKQSIMMELATTYLNSGKEKEAMALLEKAYLLAPENDNAKIAYASSLVLTGDDKKAHELFPEDSSFWTDDRLISVFMRAKAYPRVIAILATKIAKEPNNSQNYGNLASVYFQSGNKAMAIAELEIMKQKFPEMKAQVDDAIAQVNAQK